MFDVLRVCVHTDIGALLFRHKELNYSDKRAQLHRDKSSKSNDKRSLMERNDVILICTASVVPACSSDNRDLMAYSPFSHHFMSDFYDL